MICKVCGTNNEDYLEYCKKCSAPLHGSDNADNGPEAPASPRSFVRSPVWAKPRRRFSPLSPFSPFSSPVSPQYSPAPSAPSAAHGLLKASVSATHAAQE